MKEQLLKLKEFVTKNVGYILIALGGGVSAQVLLSPEGCNLTLDVFKLDAGSVEAEGEGEI